VSWYEVTRLRWTTKPEGEIHAAIARAARKAFIEVVEIETDASDDVDGSDGFEIDIVIGSAGKFAKFQLAAGETGAELVLDGTYIDPEIKDDAIDFYVTLAEELGGALDDDEARDDDGEQQAKVGPPRSVVYEAFDRDNNVVKRGDFPAKCLYDDNKTFAVLHDEGRMQLRVARVAFVETGAAGEATYRSEWRVDGYGRVIEQKGRQGSFEVGGMRGRR
jgi:hypothetical protein